MVVGCGTAAQNKSRPSLLVPQGARVDGWDGAGHSLNTCTLTSNVQKGRGVFHSVKTPWSMFPHCFRSPMSFSPISTSLRFTAEHLCLLLTPECQFM